MNFFNSCFCPQRQNQQQSNPNNAFILVSALSYSSMRHLEHNQETLKARNLSPQKHERKITNVFEGMSPQSNLETASPNSTSKSISNSQRIESMRKRLVKKILDTAFQDFIASPKKGGNQAIAMQAYEDRIEHINSMSFGEAYLEYKKLENKKGVLNPNNGIDESIKML